jgi:hypothetical protein
VIAPVPLTVGTTVATGRRPGAGLLATLLATFVDVGAAGFATPAPPVGSFTEARRLA